MFVNMIQDNLKSRKTEKALFAAMSSLLKKTSFRKMTIKGICEEALISRAAFYAHFVDKYDLLMHWMPVIMPAELITNLPYEQIEKQVNSYMQENTAILKNLIYDADYETFGIIFNAILATINLTTESSRGGERYLRDVVLANFYAGGTISYILWHIKNKFPGDVPMMNRHLYDMICDLQGWQL